MEALSLELSPEDIAEIEKGYAFDLGFPHNMLNSNGAMVKGPQDVTLSAGVGYFDYVASPSAVKPHKGDLTAAWIAPA